jgi:hypothetical protein
MATNRLKMEVETALGRCLYMYDRRRQCRSMNQLTQQLITFLLSRWDDQYFPFSTLKYKTKWYSTAQEVNSLHVR